MLLIQIIMLIMEISWHLKYGIRQIGIMDNRLLPVENLIYDSNHQ